jgi:hypothetical protein
MDRIRRILAEDVGRRERRRDVAAEDLHADAQALGGVLRLLRQ